MEIRLKTLTPIWTGGVGGGPGRLHETGIIGSLRWWYEATVRGLGGSTCDPVDGGCIYERKKGESHAEAYSRLCDACKLFGCTGWRRRFRLSADLDVSRLHHRFCLATLDQAGKFNHWWLAQIFDGAVGQTLPLADLNMEVRFLPDAGEYEPVFEGLLSLMARYGGIGAKTQYGFGQFDWSAKFSKTEALQAIRDVLTTTGRKKPRQRKRFYTLSNFWHLSCRISEQDPLIQQFRRAAVVGDRSTFSRLRDRYLPVSFDIRYKLPGSEDGGLRQAYRMKHGKMAARKVFGTLKGEKLGSRVFVSHLYKDEATDTHYQLSVWGFTDARIGDEVRVEIKRMFTTVEVKMTKPSKLLASQGGNE
jgi:CRISPR-associated protein Cmr1